MIVGHENSTWLKVFKYLILNVLKHEQILRYVYTVYYDPDILHFMVIIGITVSFIQMWYD